MAKTLTTAQVLTIVHNAGWSGGNARIAVAIAFAESNFNPTAVGGPNSDGTHDYGLFQINDVHHPTDQQKTDPQANANLAFQIYKARGNKFTDWSTFNHQGSTYQEGLTQVSSDGTKVTPTGTGTTGKDILSNIPGISQLDSTAQAAATGAQAVAKAAAWIANPQDWLRVVYVVGGAAVLLMGISMVVNSTKTGRAVTTVAATAATKVVP